MKEVTVEEIETLKSRDVDLFELRKAITQVMHYMEGTRHGIPPVIAEILKISEETKFMLRLFGVPFCRFCGEPIWHYEKVSEDGYSEHGRIHKQCRGNEAAWQDAQKAKLPQQMKLV